MFSLKPFEKGQGIVENLIKKMQYDVAVAVGSQAGTRTRMRGCGASF